MSKKLIVVDPIISNEVPNYIIQKPATDISTINYSATSTSNSLITFSNIVPPSNTFMDRRIMINFVAEFTLNAQPPYVGQIFPGGVVNDVCALRWCPVQNNSSSITLQINSANFSVNSLNSLEPMARFYMNKEFENSLFSLSPSMHDYGAYENTFGSALSPLAGPFNNSTQIPRGGIEPEIISDAGGVAVLRYSWTEYLMISPLTWYNADSQGLWGVNTLQLQMTPATMDRFLSYDNVNGTTLNSISGRFIGNPVMSIRYLTPYTFIPPGEERIYPYVALNDYSNPIGIIAGGASTTVQSSNVQLSGIPSRIYCYVRRDNARLSPFYADTYARIKSFRIFFNNKQSLLSTYTEQQLFEEVESKNGWNYPYYLTKNHIGDVIALDFGKDIPLGILEAPGLSLPRNMYVQVEFQNIYGYSENFTLFLVVCYEGICKTWGPGQASFSINTLNKEDIAETELQVAQTAPQPVEVDNFMAGGDFIGTLKKNTLKAVKGAKKGYNTVKKYLDDHPEVVQGLKTGAKTTAEIAIKLAPLVLAMLGAGVSQKSIYKELRKRGYTDRQISAAGLQFGGALQYSGSSFSDCDDDYQPITGGKVINNTRSLLKNNNKYKTLKH